MSTAIKGWRLDGDRWTTADSLPLTDRGLRYGMSVFETIGVRDGQALFMEQHAKLLFSSAKNLLGVDFHPVSPPLESHDRGMLRIYCTAGDGAPADMVVNPRVFALFEPVSGELPDDQSARLHPEPVTPFAHGAKTGNYWTQCAAQAAARAKGFDHALLSDSEGHLLSATMGNVFFVQDGELSTPSLSLAVRPGVMRSWTMAQETVREVEVAADSMEDVQEIFLTNSRLGVMPLHFGKVAPGSVGCALRDRCRQEKIIP